MVAEVTLKLTLAEALALKEKLEWLMREAKGVDIWLAPGGTLDLEKADCFLDCDEEAHFRLGRVLEKLGGNYVPHRSEGTFKYLNPTIKE
jgi:hypothetical protein